MPPVAIVFLVAPLVALLGFSVLASAARTYSSLTTRPWWQLPKLRLVRSLVFNVLALLGASVVFVLAQTALGLENLTSFGEALRAWKGAIAFFLFFLILFRTPAMFLGHGWYTLMRWRALRRSATSF
jgi:hypothetical protein